MIILRLVVLIVLLYIGWILIKSIAGSGKKKEVKGDKTGDGRVQDILVEDPVCHTLIPKHQAIRLRQDGTTYYFCSEKCSDKFMESRGKK